jgi:NADPH-dependent 2,4-dienoyl-CoA reductase/sulfur reductase-like enzyme
MESYATVILGGGMVAGYAAKELAGRGLKSGELAIVSADDAPPYERPPLSKGFLAGKKDAASVLINAPDFYPGHGITLLLNTTVTKVDFQNKRLLTSTGDQIEYGRLVIATGARVRTLELPGADLDGICYLRSLDDSRRIREQAKGAKRAVIVGSGFIGMEVAAVLAQQGLEVTLLFPGERVWQAFFTPQMSAAFQRYYEARGVRLVPGARVSGFAGDGRISQVQLHDGRKLPAELVVAGIGVMPVVDLFQDTVLKLENGIAVNEYLETEIAQVYAAGDVASYWDMLFRKRRRIEHWDNAVEQGKHVARLLAGEHRPFEHVPYFFSDVFDLSYEFWGDTSDADHVVHRGDVDGMSFSTWWLRGGRLVAAFVLNRPEQERELAPAWIKDRKEVPADLLEDASRPLDALRE